MRSCCNLGTSVLCSASAKAPHYLIPLPANLKESSPELSGFFVYEVRVGHTAARWCVRPNAAKPLLRSARLSPRLSSTAPTFGLVCPPRKCGLCCVRPRAAVGSGSGAMSYSREHVYFLRMPGTICKTRVRASFAEKG